ncbi:hypothetical protein BN7_3822 [Wickerhamomyces ciferrii]|uniref:Uncharacterized protein n=1 Tax=Wickerhamomyces ciferrii (strain ATCC 14091 / BCRC 22168 / CBS 111 / JCM 3599 / NBRC 0793 / NRRL Y-1031 F-60-10) TaxID=1206466 RepID=K0KMV3_WICCF|nr:uncharacterized protein BN7_3822 [Wickerhamomyces ciferrii]CCH44261.1 hypothetical protein BN7_3822 [Wickerhamomyces ciferrii]
MADIYSSHSEQYLHHDPDSLSNDLDSTNLKSPRSDQLSESTSNSLDVDSIESPNQSVPISRPLSRSSATSGLSVTATKDGIEGKRIKKNGIPGYPLNLINKMYTNYAKQHQLNMENEVTGAYKTNDGSPLATTQGDTESADDLWSVQSIKSATSLIPQYDPSDRDFHSERGSILSNDQYHDASDHASKNLDFFDFDQTRGQQGNVPNQYGDIPQISIENENLQERRS